MPDEAVVPEESSATMEPYLIRSKKILMSAEPEKTAQHHAHVISTE